MHYEYVTKITIDFFISYLKDILKHYLYVNIICSILYFRVILRYLFAYFYIHIYMVHLYGSRWNLNYTTESCTMPVHVRKNKWRELITLFTYNTCIALYKSTVIQLLYHSFFLPDLTFWTVFFIICPDRPTRFERNKKVRYTKDQIVMA